MSRSEACEAVLGRLRVAAIEIVLIVDHGGNGLDCWVDPKPGSYPVYSKGRCPGGRNKRTGLVHRVVWATPVTRIDWVRDEEALEKHGRPGRCPERTEIDSRVYDGG
jgi:hypothetical protein